MTTETVLQEQPEDASPSVPEVRVLERVKVATETVTKSKKFVGAALAPGVEGKVRCPIKVACVLVDVQSNECAVVAIDVILDEEDASPRSLFKREEWEGLRLRAGDVVDVHLRNVKGPGMRPASVLLWLATSWEEGSPQPAPDLVPAVPEKMTAKKRIVSGSRMAPPPTIPIVKPKIKGRSPIVSVVMPRGKAELARRICNGEHTHPAERAGLAVFFDKALQADAAEIEAMEAERNDEKDGDA